jgi:hypothetical protein
VVSTPLKNIGQLGLLFPIYGRNKTCSKPPTSNPIYLLEFFQFRVPTNLTTEVVQQTHLPSGLRKNVAG